MGRTQAASNWRNQFSFLKSDRLSFIVYWLHREIIIMLLLSVKKTITKDNALSQERRQISSSSEHTSPRVTTWALSRSTVCYLARSVRALGHKEGMNLFVHWSNKQRENDRVYTSLLQRPTTSAGGGAGKVSSHVLPVLRSHHMFGCHPYSQQTLEQGIEFIQTPLTRADGHPAFSDLSQALNRQCWNHWAQWNQLCTERVYPSPHQSQMNPTC